MALGKKTQKALNEQIAKEWYSAYLYMGMAAWFEEQDLPGCANWMKVQAQEELAHGLILFNYLADQGASIKLAPVEAPTTSYKSIVAVFEKQLEHEKTVTASIHKIVDAAIDENDHASRVFLDWFVKEQVEEEATAETILGKVKRIGDSGAGLLMLDGRLGERQFQTPSPLAGA